MGDTVLTTREGPVATITLNEPDRKNALAPHMRDGLIAALTALMADRDCRAIILTGAGSAFSAGGDLSTMGVRDAGAVRQRLATLHVLVRLVAAGTKPVVAAVNGDAFGAGMSLALASDYIVCSDKARFGAAFARIGLMADSGMMWSLTQRVGMGEAKRIMLASRVVDGTTAAAMGLADRAVAPSELLDQARAIALEFAQAPPLVVAMTKAHINGALSLESVLTAELDGQTLLTLSDDFDEGRRAFLEKRKPSFIGR